MCIVISFVLFGAPAKFPLLPPNADKLDLDSDALFAKNSSAVAYCIGRTISELLRDQQLIVKAAKMFRFDIFVTIYYFIINFVHQYGTTKEKIKIKGLMKIKHATLGIHSRSKLNNVGPTSLNIFKSNIKSVYLNHFLKGDALLS